MQVTQWGQKPALLGCFPLPVDEVLLIGERKLLHLREPSLLDLFAEAQSASAGVFAAVVVIAGGDSLVQRAPLVEVRSAHRWDEHELLIEVNKRDVFIRLTKQFAALP